MNLEDTPIELSQTSQLAKQLRESQMLFEISQMLAGTVDLSTTLQQIADAATTLIKSATRTVLHLLDESGDYLQSVAVSGPDRPKTSQRMRFKLGEGIAGIALASGKTINVPDIHSEPRFIPIKFEGLHPPRSLLVAPVKTDEKSLGTLSVHSPTPGVFTSDDERLLTILGIQAAVAIDKARLLRTEQEQRKLAEALIEIGAALNQTLDFEKILDLLLDQAERLIPYNTLNIILVSDNRASVVRSKTSLQAGRRSQGILKNRSISVVEEPLLRMILETGKPMIVSDLQAGSWWQEIEWNAAIRSWILAPVIAQEEFMAVFWLGSLTAGFYNFEHIKLLVALVNQAALALQNAKLFEKTQQSLKDLQVSLEHEKIARTQLVQAEKLAALGQIVASVAHELNNPLQAIQNALYLIKTEGSFSPQAHDDLQTVLDESERMANLIDRLREMYRPATNEELQLESINSLVDEVHKLLGTHLRHNQILFEFFPDVNLPEIPMIRDQIKQVILNICLNAVEAMPEGGRLTILTTRHPRSSQILLSISDNGPSISEDILPYIFDPFVTTKEGGTGLGLAITYDIVSRHGGHIDVDSKTGKGTTFKVWLPKKQVTPTSQSR